MSHKFIRAAIVAACLPALAACGTSSASSTASSNASSTAASSPNGTSAAQVLQLTDGWVKSGAKRAMTAAFGTLRNSSDSAVVVVGVASDVGTAELHTTEPGSGQMKQVDSFTVPAHGTFALTPGGNHLMLTDLTADLPAGSQVHITLRTRSGESTAVTLPVRAFAGANESYAPGAAPSSSMPMATSMTTSGSHG